MKGKPLPGGRGSVTSESAGDCTHVCFKAESSSAHKEIYPGYGLINLLRIDYYVDNKLFDDDTAMNMDVRIELVSDPMPQKSQKVPMRSIQEF